MKGESDGLKRELALVSFCPAQIPDDLTWDQTLAAAVASADLGTTKGY